MCKDNHRDEGILPTIEKLKSSFDELRDTLAPLLESELSQDSYTYFQQKIEQITARMTNLPDTVSKSYELIQLVIKSIHSSRSELKKSVDGLIKKTGMQLQKVTSTTEEATNKILDVAEKLDRDQLTIIGLVDQLALHSSGKDDDFAKLTEEIKVKLHLNQESAFTIMDYLQFQDITAQQIAGAYALLSDTEKTLIFVSDLLKKFDLDHAALEAVVSPIDHRSFNMDASFVDKKELQDAIDNLFSGQDVDLDNLRKTPEQPIKEIPKGTTGETVSDDDIDALFGSKPASEAKETMDADDIDALFSSPSKEKKEDKQSEAATQDDIDKLFSS